MALYPSRWGAGHPGGRSSLWRLGRGSGERPYLPGWTLSWVPMSLYLVSSYPDLLEWGLGI